MGLTRLLLRNRMLLGDTVMMTAGVRDLARAHRARFAVRVETAYPQLWENNPHLAGPDVWPPSAPPDRTEDVGPSIVTQGSIGNGLHFSTAFRVCLEKKLELAIPQGPLRGDLHLSENEMLRPDWMPPRYWVICTDCGPYDSKRWPENRWQELIDSLPWIVFVHVGLAKWNRRHLGGSNVMDRIGADSTRSLLQTLYHAEGLVGLISGPMHVAGAFQRAAVIIAGAREPATFEAYPEHRYLSQVGTLPCARTRACWRCALGACRNHGPEGHAACMEMTMATDVRRAIETYYQGGALERSADARAPVMIMRKPILKVISNGTCYGGAERSVVQILRMADAAGWRTQLVTRGGGLCSAMARELPSATIRTHEATTWCDVLLLYASDMVFDFGKPEFAVMERLRAERRIMALTYRLGKAPMAGWARGWNRYVFLSSAMQRDFFAAMPGAATIVLPPPVDLGPFHLVNPNYELPIRIMRHGSQGDAKFPRDLPELIAACGRAVRFAFMPAPSWLNGEHPNIERFAENALPVSEFLARGNAFWYPLPDGYSDQGPRAIMEAMAAGLPVMAEARDGAIDRVTPETGWLVSTRSEMPDIIRSLDSREIERRGCAARERARSEFRPERWMELLRGDL